MPTVIFKAGADFTTDTTIDTMDLSAGLFHKLMPYYIDYAAETIVNINPDNWSGELSKEQKLLVIEQFKNHIFNGQEDKVGYEEYDVENYMEDDTLTETDINILKFIVPFYNPDAVTDFDMKVILDKCKGNKFELLSYAGGCMWADLKPKILQKIEGELIREILNRGCNNCGWCNMSKTDECKGCGEDLPKRGVKRVCPI